MNRKLTLLAGIAVGVYAVLSLRRRSSLGRGGPAADPRADDLRRKLAEARDTVADEEDFEAAGMAGETLIEDKPTTPIRPAAAMSGGDVDEERRRIHDEARKAAEEMRRSGGPDPS